jgi:hypothetical protein
MAGGTLGVELVGGFETRNDFWLFLAFCALFAIPCTFVIEYFWPTKRS